MSQSSSKPGSFWATFFGSLGAILIFAVIIFIAYLPNRPAPVDQAANEARRATAEQARAEGIAKITGYVANPDGSVQIPVDVAMDLVTNDYKD